MRQYAYLSEGDVVAIESLAPEIGNAAIAHASLAALALRVIHDLLKKAQSVAVDQWNLSAQEKADWKNSLNKAGEELPKLEESCNNLIAQKA